MKNLWKNIKKSGYTFGEVYFHLGTRHQYVSRWRAKPESTLTKEGLKYSTIIRAGELFELTEAETEALANRAGLSLCHIPSPPKPSVKMEAAAEIFPYNATAETPPNAAFVRHFYKLIQAYPGKLTELQAAALVSERMFRYIKSGRHIKKEPTLALLIVMEQGLLNVQKCLKMAGFILSKSISGDAVIMWLLENELHKYDGASRVFRVNEILDSLGLPLLMTRQKNDNG